MWCGGALRNAGGPHAGATAVVAVDLDERKLALAAKLGATHTVNARHVDAVEATREATCDRGADVILECAGNSQTFRQSTEAVRVGGQVIWLGKIDVSKDASFLFGKVASELEYKPFPQPSGSLSHAYTDPLGLKMGPMRLLRCGLCEWFGCSYCSKASPQTTILPYLVLRAELHWPRQLGSIRINIDKLGKTATGATFADSSGDKGLQRRAGSALNVVDKFVGSSRRSVWISSCHCLRHFGVNSGGKWKVGCLLVMLIPESTR